MKRITKKIVGNAIRKKWSKARIMRNIAKNSDGRAKEKL